MEATKLLRLGGYNNLLVGVTGNVLEDDMAEYLDAGADIILTKPMKINVLLMLLHFIDFNGVMSRKGYTLVEHNNALQWSQSV